MDRLRRLTGVQRARGPRRHDAGLTMIEVMIALGILAVGLMALLAMSISALHAGRVGRDLTMASRIAQDRMEALQRLPWIDVAVTGGWTAAQTEEPELTAEDADARLQSYQIQERIQAVAGNTNLRTLDVRVTWTEANDPPGTPARRYAISSVRHNDP